MLDGVRTPQSVESEQALIGAILLANSSLEKVPSSFGAESFHDPVNARMWAAIKQRIESGKIVTAITLKALMAEDPGFHEAGGANYLGHIMQVAATPSTVKSYAETIMEMAERRAFMELCGQGLVSASRADLDFREVRSQIEASLLASEPGGPDAAMSIGDASRMAAFDIAQAAREGVSLAGLSTGFQAVDDTLGGMKPGNLVILAGRPSMGKTASAVWTALRSAQSGVGTYFVTLEMSEDELSRRAISAVSAQINQPIAYADMQHPDKMTERDVAAIRRSQLELGNLPLIMAPRHVRSVGRIMTDVRRAKRKLEARGHPLGLIIVDYLQLLRSDGARRDNRVAEVSDISAALKGLAKEMDVPVLALSQLSRQVESREDKRPMLSDLRESGSIEQDADSVIFVFREDYYIERAEPKGGTPEHMDWRQRMDEVKGRVDFIVAKNRHGAIGTAKVMAQIHTNSFA